jgi:hypothetical protein
MADAILIHSCKLSSGKVLADRSSSNVGQRLKSRGPGGLFFIFSALRQAAAAVERILTSALAKEVKPSNSTVAAPVGESKAESIRNGGGKAVSG